MFEGIRGSAEIVGAVLSVDAGGGRLIVVAERGAVALGARKGLKGRAGVRLILESLPTAGKYDASGTCQRL